MPILKNSDYHPFLPLRWGHVNTIVPNLFRNLGKTGYQRERIELEDGDFLDLDFLDQKSDHSILLCHGLEGNSQAQYIRGLARQFSSLGWNVYAMNYRGCSGEPNRLLRAYHSGATEDLEAVINWISTNHAREQLHLVGFSLGGNLVLKYLGEKAEKLVGKVPAAVAVSVPVALFEAVESIQSPRNFLYNAHFLLKLRRKVREKSAVFKAAGWNPNEVLRLRKMREFDDWYTAPVHGFENAEDYYHKSSSLYVLDKIHVPTLILNARDDSFLSPKCFPEEIARSHDHVYLETPEYGGHVGFMDQGLNGQSWAESRIIDFFGASEEIKQKKS